MWIILKWLFKSVSASGRIQSQVLFPTSALLKLEATVTAGVSEQTSSQFLSENSRFSGLVVGLREDNSL